MSDNSFSIRVKMGESEIELKGGKDDVLSVINDLPKIIPIISNSFNVSAIRVQQADTTSITPTEFAKKDFPTLKLSPDVSCPEVIINILSTGWGKMEPRTLREIIEAMKINALHYPEGTIKGRLTDLTKRGVLRRIRTGMGYGYTLIKVPEP